MSTPAFTPYESKARIHAHVAFAAFLIGLPLGTLMARYLRTFTNSWFWPHVIVNLLFTGPIVLTAFALGYQATNIAGVPHFVDPHQKTGLALFVMYLIQVLLGFFIHWVKFPSRFPGGRAPQNYLHAILGLAIIALACFQTHFGMWNEWPFVTGNVHPIDVRYKHFWLAIVIVIWSLYAIGLLLLPRQFRQEAAARHDAKEDHEG
ncbi:hypothetical protein B0H14DRAFT_3131444 [Mycena olivaceomarginata]|nr:hypothetical protein B0H14DRAFT_3131444 [Mycena olivaceomarginata]